MKRRKSTTGEEGFTLLELLVTLTVASLMLIVVAPQLVNTVSHARLEASAAQIMVALKETRMSAMRTSEPSFIAINSASYLVSGKPHSLTTGQTLHVARDGQTLKGTEASVEFFPDGTSNGGTITITNSNDGIQIDVDWLTGKVSSGD